MRNSRPLIYASRHFLKLIYTEDLQKIDVPTLILHGDDDQIVPIGASALLSSKIVKNATLKVYPGFPHGMCSTHKDVINADLLAFRERRKSGISMRGVSRITVVLLLLAGGEY